MAASASSCCSFLALSRSLSTSCQSNQPRTQWKENVPIAVRLPKFMYPFLQILNTVQWLRVAPRWLCGGTTQLCLSDIEYEDLTRSVRRVSVLGSDEQWSEVTNFNQRPGVSSKPPVAFCIPEVAWSEMCTNELVVNSDLMHSSTTSLGIRPCTSCSWSESTTQK